MRKLGLIIGKEYVQRVKTRAFIISTLIAPVLMALLLLGPALLAEGTGTGRRRVVVLDESGVDLVPKLQRRLDIMSGDAQGDGDAGLSSAERDTSRALDGSQGDDVSTGRHDDGRSMEPGLGDDRIALLAAPGADLSSLREELADKVESGELDGLVYLPPSFLETGEAQFFTADPSGLVWSERLENALGAVAIEARLASHGLSSVDSGALLRRADLERLHIVGDAEGGDSSMGARLVVGVVMVFMLYMMILMYGLQAMNGIIEDKASRVVEVMLASVSSTELMVGKIVSSALVGATQVGIWGVVAVGVIAPIVARTRDATDFPGGFSLDFLTPGLWLGYILFFVLGFLMFSCLYASIGSLCTSTQDAQQFQFPITILVIIPMMLLQVVMQNPDSTLAVVMSLIPVFTPIMMFARVMMGNPPLWQVILSIVLLAGTVLLLARMAAKLFRLAILSYGKSPSWGQVLRMLRAPE